MFKLLTTLFRARAAEAAASVADQYAVVLLGQQIRDATAELRASKRALALAMVQHEREGRRSDEIAARLADLEARAVAALQGGRDDLAGEAAQAIAGLEAERSALEEARQAAAKDIVDLKAGLRHAAFRLADLERGRRIAAAAESLARLKTRTTGSTSALAEAERTLAQLRAKRVEAADVEAALAALDPDISPAAVTQRLETEGFGPRRVLAADAVLARLKLKARTDAQSPAPSATALLPGPAACASDHEKTEGARHDH